MNKEVRIVRLNERINCNIAIAQEAMREYEIITDQYMNGDIVHPIGKEQAWLQRIYEKAMRQVEKDRAKIRQISERV